ncbi:MAG: aminopeptidase [Bacteroidia bacterium]
MKGTLKILWNLLLWLCLCFLSLYYDSAIYIFFQAKGQLHMMMNTTSFEAYRRMHAAEAKELAALDLISELKQYSVDSLGYQPTKNFTTVYDQGDSPLLWAITASEKFSVKARYWEFPIVGKVSYKGFFDAHKALAEKNRLIVEGCDVDLRSVSAWSTLGWLSDPVLSSMLRRSKGGLCNLIFHELFHATYYAPSSVDDNENLASFVAHKATLRFLKGDTAEHKAYLDNYNSNRIIEHHMGEQRKRLLRFYDSIAGFSDSDKKILRLKELVQISRSLDNLSGVRPQKIKALRAQILDFKNAWFVDFEQYNVLQDSLENAFNKFYESDIRKMVQSLKRK